MIIVLVAAVVVAPAHAAAPPMPWPRAATPAALAWARLSGAARPGLTFELTCPRVVALDEDIVCVAELHNEHAEAFVCADVALGDAVAGSHRGTRLRIGLEHVTMGTVDLYYSCLGRSTVVDYGCLPPGGRRQARVRVTARQRALAGLYRVEVSRRDAGVRLPVGAAAVDVTAVTDVLVLPYARGI